MDITMDTMESSKIEITEDIFGVLPAKEGQEKGQTVKRFTLTNNNRMKVQLINYGATITSIQVEDAFGELRDVVLGFDDIDGYLGAYGRNPYFGAVIGRVANRTGNAKFSLNSQDYQLTANNGTSHLHGGLAGFDKQIWETYVDGSKIIFSYLSADGKEGYPGSLLVHVTYQLTADNKLLINYKAVTTKPTPVCLTNHSYFNLAGHDKAHEKLEGHLVQLEADHYTVLNDELVASGEIKSVQGTLYDLRAASDLNGILKKFPAGPNEYDINFCVRIQDRELPLVGRLTNKNTQIALEVTSDQPGVQFYTSNFFPDPEKNEAPLLGKNKAPYFKHGACCFETQYFPNAINLPNFKSVVLNPGETYNHDVSFQFGLAPVLFKGFEFK